jgi:hypothetical protein
MTISQHRVISIINAGRDFQAGLARLVLLIDEQRNAAKANEISAEAALESVYLAAGDRLLSNAAESRSTLEIEFAHFRANRTRNDRNRLKAEKRRRAAGVTPRETQSTPFIPTAPKLPHQSPTINPSYDPSDPENQPGGMFALTPEEHKAMMDKVDEELKKANLK